jgi:hypothetical protein
MTTAHGGYEIRAAFAWTISRGRVAVSAMMRPCGTGESGHVPNPQRPLNPVDSHFSDPEG